MVKLLAGGCLYRLLAAVAQPVADKRLTECVDGLGRGILLLLRIFLFTGSCFSFWRWPLPGKGAVYEQVLAWIRSILCFLCFFRCFFS
ncbi:MAG: stage III sporulation protein AE [Lachnospiraceae bacterium]